MGGQLLFDAPAGAQHPGGRGRLRMEGLNAARPLMLRSALVALAVTAGSLPALAGAVDPEIHKLCIEAKDYPGCVRAMKGDTSPALSGTRVINQQGADIVEGNQCQPGSAYVGGGNCKTVKCDYYSGSGHDQLVAGLKTRDGKDRWGCPRWGMTAGNMRLTDSSRAYHNPKCPAGEPRIGYGSTCEWVDPTDYTKSEGDGSWAFELNN